MITLTPRPLTELSKWQEERAAERRARHALMEKEQPGLLEQLRQQIKEYDEKHPESELKQAMAAGLAAAEAAYRAKHGPARPDTRPSEQFERDHPVRWRPFSGQGRHSPDGRWHIAWGQCGSDQYRVALSCGDELRAWLEPSVRIVAGWVSDDGFICVQDFSGGDEVTFVFADMEGNAFHHWTRPRKFLRFIRFDADGMGYAWHDEAGEHTVRFENAS